MAHLATREERGPLRLLKLAVPGVCARLQDPQPHEPLAVPVEVCRHGLRRQDSGAGEVGSQEGERGRAKGDAAAHLTLVVSRIFQPPPDVTVVNRRGCGSASAHFLNTDCTLDLVVVSPRAVRRAARAYCGTERRDS